MSKLWRMTTENNMNDRAKNIINIWVLALCVFCLSVLQLENGLADALTSVPTYPESIISSMSVSQYGDKTKGITYTVHDIYYDGMLLMLSITQSPNEDEYVVYNSPLSSFETSSEVDEIKATGAKPLGCYCEANVYGADGEEINGGEEGNGWRDGSAYVRTFEYHFSPDEIQDELRVKISHGVMETYGQVVGEMASFEFTLTLQKPRDTVSDNQ